ncbi:MAG: hypothetical protein PX637_07935, partial [Microcystis sp. M53601_WE4]|nr:hypothetical protein [Microcystis sp. M53601_WE4]
TDPRRFSELRSTKEKYQWWGVRGLEGKNWLFWFLCGNEVYTDRISVKIVLKVLPDKHSTIP